MINNKKYFLLGIGVALAFWCIESMVSVELFGGGSFVEEILPLHNPRLLWIKVVTVSVIIFLGYIQQCLMNNLTASHKMIKQSENELQININILNNAQEIAHVGSWHLDIKKNALSWSDEVYRIFGVQPQEFVPTYEAFLEFVHPDDKELVNKTYLDAIENNKCYEMVHRIVRHDGEVRVVYEKSKDTTDESGNIIHSFGMVHDITEIKKDEAELEKLIDQLKNSINEINKLQGILPICARCKKIRDSDGYWKQVESYIETHSEAKFSHSLCEKCVGELYGDQEWYQKGRLKPEE